MKLSKIMMVTIAAIAVITVSACGNETITTEVATEPDITSEISEADPSATTLIPQQTTLIPQNDENGDNATTGDYTYGELEGGTIEILSYEGPGGVVDVPGQIDGHEVSKIDYLVFYENLEITELTIPEGLTELEPFNFHSMYNLTKLTIGNGPTRIPDSAISTNTGLVTLILPDSIEILDDYAILGNEALMEVHIGANIASVGIGNFHQSNNLTVYGPANSPMQDYCEEQQIEYVVQ